MFIVTISIIGVVTVDDFLHTDQSNTENYPEQNMVEKVC